MPVVTNVKKTQTSAPPTVVESSTGSESSVDLKRARRRRKRDNKRSVEIQCAMDGEDLEPKQIGTQTVANMDVGPPPTPTSSDGPCSDGSLGDDSDSSIVEVDNRATRVSEWSLNCKVDNTQFRAVIDSGATISTMNVPTFEKLGGRYPLQLSKTRVRGVSGHVEVHGTVSLPMNISHSMYDVRFIVMDFP